jgi:hypothetical protein
MSEQTELAKALAQAAERSRGCPECEGNGLSVRWNRRPNPGPNGKVLYVAFTVYCHLCPMGRHVKMRHEATCPTAWSRVTDLADCPELQPTALRFRPDQRAAIGAADAVDAVGAPTF